MKSFQKLLCLILLSAVSLPLADQANASISCNPWVAKMVSVQGTVEVNRAGQTQWLKADINDTYCAGDRIQVGERSRADLALVNRPKIRLEQNTTLTLAGVRDEKRSIIQLARGALYFFSRLPQNLEVITAFVNAGVEGTEGLVKVDADSTLITIFEGRVVASNPSGSLILTGGQSAIARQGSAPVLTTIVRPRDAVQWALYYPPVFDFKPENFPNTTWQASASQSIAAYKQGDFTAAFESLRAVPDTIADSSFFTYRAALLLAVGRNDEASRDVQRALSLRASDSAALALQAVIAVAQNEKEKAIESAQKAVTADPKSSSALIALSYAQQANFNLEGARNSLKQAVEANPSDALAWARLAELHLSFADLDDALAAAKRATAVDPNLSRTQTVLGFAYLTRVNTSESKKAFEKAIQLDQADPLPRLGLGLAKIREGDLAEGREEIDIAVSLDPDNSLVRSYLGKAYFEEKLDQQSATQYDLAKSLDPKDPTPYFYDAIRKQTTNRPVEALQDLQKAIELNDNRAVYRSRLQLDSDLAARSASLGRIYSDLGFQQLALVEGWKSVNTDPTNFSAHRFLADSYAILPRHEIARVSELLQSQLLQPLNMTPIQPHLAESNLFLISAGGPASLSFNEFNPLFNRNGITFQTTGLTGENKTYAGEGVLSGIYQKAAFSVGGFNFQTDGWRTNADQKDTIANAFLQFELSPQTSIQGEYRYRAFRSGDIALRFFSEDFSPGQRDKEEKNTARLGLRHAFSANSTILGSLIHQEVTFASDVGQLRFPVISVNSKRPESATSIELQHLFRFGFGNLTSGVGYAKVDGHTDIAQQFAVPLPPPPLRRLFTIRLPTDLKQANTYIYSNLNLLADLTLTLGVSGDFTNGESPDVGNKRQFNPKFGVTWNPWSQTTIRAAAFRVLKRTLITNQTIEPTQVAGFNQFFDDNNGTSAWRYGVAVDQKFTKALFGGSEFTRRDLNSPSVRSDIRLRTVTLVKQDVQEDLSRVYLFWTPHPWWALRAEYQFEHLNSEGRGGLPSRLQTHRIPLGISFFHPSGLGASLKTTYLNQAGRFIRTSGSHQNGSDEFWTVDAAVHYRLPSRYGTVTFGATNLTDQNFKFFERDLKNQSIQPNRILFGKITLVLP